MTPIRVLLLHASDAWLTHLQTLLNADKRFEVVGLAKSGSECLRMAPAARPQVLLMDLTFPDLAAGGVIRQLLAKTRDIAVVIGSAHAIKGNAMLDDAVQAGAFDFVLCPNDPAKLGKIARQLLTVIMVAAMSHTKPTPAAQAPNHEGASPRLDAILIDCATERADEFRAFARTLRSRIRPAILAILRMPPPYARDLQSDLGVPDRPPVELAQDGTPFAAGRLYLVNQSFDDLTLVRARSRKGIVFQRNPRGDEVRDEPGPAPAPLYQSFAQCFESKGEVLLVGLPHAQAVDSLLKARDLGVRTAIEDHSPAALSMAKSVFPEGSPPGTVGSLTEIASTINALPLADD